MLLNFSFFLYVKIKYKYNEIYIMEGLWLDFVINKICIANIRNEHKNKKLSYIWITRQIK